MWESVKESMFGDQGSDAKALFTRTASIWLLGTEYSTLRQIKQAASKLEPNELRILCAKEIRRRNEKVLHDFASRIWFTYRECFPDMSGWQSDAGWGCTLRTSQMMFCQGLIMHCFGRHWRLKRGKERGPLYAKILRWFLDYPTEKCPYSLHNILRNADRIEKKVGEWFGPQAACFLIKYCHEQHISKGTLELLPALHVASDGTLYLDQILDLCTKDKECPSKQREPNVDETKEQDSSKPTPSKGTGESKEEQCSSSERKLEGLSASQKKILQSTGEWKSLIIIIPVRLGLDSINPKYCDGLKECLKLPQSLGFVGGRPRSSYYFIGYQADRLLYLDPHTIQKVCPLQQKLERSSGSFHCSRIQTLPMNDLDPSLALGFYCRDRNEFFDLWNSIEHLESGHFPPFRTAMTVPKYTEINMEIREIEEDENVEGTSRSKEKEADAVSSPHTGRSKQSTDDGFVLI